MSVRIATAVLLLIAVTGCDKWFDRSQQEVVSNN
jgi:hypothetical protein